MAWQHVSNGARQYRRQRRRRENIESESGVISASMAHQRRRRNIGISSGILTWRV